MIDTLKIANKVGLDVSVSIPLTQENAGQAEQLLDRLGGFRIIRTSCFIPHCEGRGHFLEDIRLTADDYEQLSGRVKTLVNRERFRTEQEWFSAKELPEPDRRVLTVTLTPENIDFFEKLDFGETITWLENLDDTYYSTVPSFRELLKQYGDPNGRKLYSARDLYMYYQKKYLTDHQISVYDMNDERHCFSRRI